MLFGCGKTPDVPPAPSAAPPLVSGIDIQYFDPSVRPQEDFYKHINGKWLADTEIPPDKGSYGTFMKLSDDSEAKLHAIIEDLQKSVDPGDPDQQKIADLYSSFMDEPTLESLGIRPLSGEFAKIDALKDKKEITGLIAHFNEIGVAAPFSPGASGRQGFHPICLRPRAGRSWDARSRLLPAERRQDEAGSHALRRNTSKRC